MEFTEVNLSIAPALMTGKLLSLTCTMSNREIYAQFNVVNSINIDFGIFTKGRFVDSSATFLSHRLSYNS